MKIFVLLPPRYCNYKRAETNDSDKWKWKKKKKRLAWSWTRCVTQVGNTPSWKPREQHFHETLIYVRFKSALIRGWKPGERQRYLRYFSPRLKRDTIERQLMARAGKSWKTSDWSYFRIRVARRAWYTTYSKIRRVLLMIYAGQIFFSFTSFR